jgi:hypothetical protein
MCDLCKICSYPCISDCQDTPYNQESSYYPITSVSNVDDLPILITDTETDIHVPDSEIVYSEWVN